METPGRSQVHVREYAPTDRQACLSVFDSNVPDFFRAFEREEFEDFLADLPGPFVVLEDGSGRIVGCGGYAVEEGTRVADLCWGMIVRERHGAGLGRLLTRARLRRIAADGSVREVALRTSQHTTGFYERLGFETEHVVEDGFAPGLHRCEMRLRLDGDVEGEG